MTVSVLNSTPCFLRMPGRASRARALACRLCPRDRRREHLQAIDGKSDEKLVARQKLAPASSSSVPLVWNALSTVLPFAYCFCNATTRSKNGIPAALAHRLPGKADMVIRLRLNVLTNVGFEHIIRHAEFAPTACVEIFLFQVVAVGAIEIADCAMRLGHDVKRLHRNAALFLVRNLGGCPMKKPTRQRLVAGLRKLRRCGSVKIACARHSTRLLDCRRGDRQQQQRNARR